MRKAIVFILLLGSPLSYAVLSATTVNTIQGNKPALIINSRVLSTLDELLTITAPDGHDIPTSQTVITVDQQHLMNQFQTIFPADSSSHTLSSAYFHDQDGDIPHMFTPVSGSYQATLSYFDVTSGYDIKITDLNQPFDACLAPYTLTIKADHVKVESEYGDPRVNPYGTQTRQIQIKVNGSGICYVRSESRATNNSWAYKKIEGASGIHPTRGGYYYPDQLLTRRGFVPYLNPAFPTTGFKGATFRLVMPNAQTDYTYQSSDAGAASVDSSGLITLHQKPAGPVTITITPHSTGTQLHYTFNIQTWATPTAEHSKTWQEAKDICGSIDNMISYKALTNSPAADSFGFIVPIPVNAFTRGIGSLGSEWGYLSNYEDALGHRFWWIAESWTKENNGTHAFTVHPLTGEIDTKPLTDKHAVVCKD